jgi:hypothetical protein
VLAQRLLEKGADAALIFDDQDLRGGSLCMPSAPEMIAPRGARVTAI